MKYWHQLSNVEEAIFQIRKIRSQLSVMMDSELIASSNNDEFPETYKDFLYDLSERFENAMDTLNVEFQNLWDVVRNDSFEEEKPELPNDRWNHIVRDLQNWNEQSTKESILVVREEDGIITTSYRPATAEDSFDNQWKEAYKKQSDR